MVLPTQQRIELPLLKVLSDNGGQLPTSDAIERVSGFFPDITDEERASRLKSGANRWKNRVRWAKQNLIQTGELDNSVRGIWKLTEKGEARLKDEWPWDEHGERKNASLNPNDQEQHEALMKRLERETWMEHLKSESQETGVSPEEYLEDTLANLSEAVESEILDTLSKVDPSSFESIIGELLEKMGYGDIQVTGRSGDGGIDGTCSTDALGLYKLHFQAKRWKNQVGAKEIRDFIGGIQTSHGEFGIFVTTSDFSKDALETGKKSSKLKLINGMDLAGLMVKYGLGVTKTQLQVARIDRDYFEGL